MKILFLDSVHEVLELELLAHGFTCVHSEGLSRAECETLARDVDGIVIRSRFRMDAGFLEHAPLLKFIARSGAGMENIDEAYCAARKITLFNAPEGNRNAVAEHALGMLLALFNRIIPADGEVRNGVWDREGNRGVELDGKTVGIIGYGNNGSAFAKKLQGFDVQVLAYDKYKSGFGHGHVTESTMERIFAEADVVSFHIPQNSETLFTADANFFTRFAKPIYLINLSRGKIVRTEALVDALNEGKVLGACLDVLEFEPSSFENLFDQDLPEYFKLLLQDERVIFSPHVGGWTQESYYKLSKVLAKKILERFG
jgi:D-3-phosphoglycerate dehydrogenase